METSNTQRILGECADRALSRFPGTSRAATDDRTFYFTSLLAYELCNAGSPLGTKLLDLVELSANSNQTAHASLMSLPKWDGVARAAMCQAPAAAFDAERPLQRALAIATEFKYLLDIQPDGALFHPAPIGDARSSAGYKQAARLLSELLLEDNDRAERPYLVLRFAVPVGDLVSDHGAQAPADFLDIFHEVVVAPLLSLSVEKINERGHGTEYGCLFELRRCDVGGVNKGSQFPCGKGSAVHPDSPSS